MTLDTFHANLGNIVHSALKRHARTRCDLAGRLGICDKNAERRLTGQRGFRLNELLAAATWLGECAGDWLHEAGMNELTTA